MRPLSLGTGFKSADVGLVQPFPGFFSLFIRPKLSGMILKRKS